MVQKMKGVKHYTSDAGFHCIRVHYSADPEKDPATPIGAHWFEGAVKGYPGGTKSSAWRQEMEIDWESSGGELVFPQLTDYEERIVINPFEIPESWDCYGSFDYGHRNPSSFHIYAIDHDGNVYAAWEYYMAGKGYKSIADAIRSCPYWDRMQYLPIADPSIWAKNQQNQVGGDENDMKSIAQLFTELPAASRIWFAPGKKGGDITVAEKINGLLWNEDDLKKGEKPRLYIFKTCPMQIWEMKKLRYADWSATMQEQRNIKEEIVDRDNHAFDDLKMFLTMFFASPDEPKPPKMQKLKEIDPVSYNEWISVAKMHGEIQSGKGGSMGDFE
jgi:hypothetical protein